jgi:hypothetical protein
MSLQKIAAVLNEWWDQGDHVAFVAEETMIGIYSGGAFVGVLHWRMAHGDPLTMVVSFVKTDDLDHIRSTLRLYLMRTLSAILPAYVRITIKADHSTS